MADAPHIGEPVAVVRVQPEQFKIDVELDRELFLDLVLTNTSASLATFKVKTTARERYLLRPTQDYIQPHASVTCKIVMSKMKEYPDLSNPKNLKDKFLVQSTTLEHEVPDLTKFWKDLETHHSPKDAKFLYAETKIKCKLQVPAKLRAQDAAKRGQAEEEAAAAGSAVVGKSPQEEAQQASAHTHPPVEPITLTDRRPSHNPASDVLISGAAPATGSPLVAAFQQHVHAVPLASEAAAAGQSAAPAAASASVASAAPASAAASAVQASLDAEKAKYAELMEFMVRTTQQLEAERLEKEAWEGKYTAEREKTKGAEARAARAESAAAQAKEDARTALAASKLSGSASDNDVSEGALSTRRRVGRDSDADRLAPPTVPSPQPSLSASSLSSSSSSTLLSDKHSSANGLSLQLWQVALMALVCFVLGRIFA